MSDARQIREQLDAAHAAAERLVREAEERVRAHAADIPPRGWEAPREPQESQSFVPELGALLGLFDQAKGAIPPELARQLAEAVRDLLVAIRALIDWYVERLERPAAEPKPVEDIPIA